jgi:hypothetical protein
MISESDFEQLIDGYCRILAPIFQPTGDRFDYLLALLRASGHENAGWDTLSESFKVLDDLNNLASAELPADYFKEPQVTQLRLRLFEYSHLVEMSAPYEIIANLLRVKLGRAVSLIPFTTSSKPNSPTSKKTTSTSKQRPTYPSTKINTIKSLATEAGLPDIGAAFDNFYRAGIRNSISHSDYIIHGNEFRMRGQTISDELDPRVTTSVITIERLQQLIDQANAFYLAFVRVEKGARLNAGANKQRGFPYDKTYKGILEVLVDDEDYLCGAVIHWPNGQESYFERTAAGSRSMNLMPLDGNFETFVGHIHSPHDPFSPLLRPGESPRYTNLRGISESLDWNELQRKAEAQ